MSLQNIRALGYPHPVAQAAFNELSAVLVFLFSMASTSFAMAKDTDYYTKADHPGQHYDCTKPLDDGSMPVFAYENDKIFIACEGFTVKRVWPEGMAALVQPWHWEWTADRSAFLVKGDPMTQEEIDAVIFDQMGAPFYDSSERRMVKWNGAMLAADLLTTAYGIKFGGCREANPIMAQAPVIGVGIAAWQFMDTRAKAKKTPRFFTASRDFEPWVPVATHGAAAVNNIVRCF